MNITNVAMTFAAGFFAGISASAFFVTFTGLRTIHANRKRIDAMLAQSKDLQIDSFRAMPRNDKHPQA